MRRTEDRIRKLCAEILLEEDPEKCRQLIASLRIELRNYIATLRGRAGEYPVMKERRRYYPVD